MKSKGLSSVPIALCALLLLLAAPAQARHTSGKCTARNAHTIVSTETGRIFATPLDENASRIYACLYSQNRRRFLGIDGDCDPGPAVERFVMIGRYVGYVVVSCNIDSGTERVVVRDLRTGRNKYGAVAATGQRAEQGEPSTLVQDFAMSRTGSIAWIGEWDAVSGDSGTHPNDDLQVRKLEPGAPAGGTLLDSGDDIELGSLGLSSRTRAGYSWLYWQKSGAAQSGKLN